MARVALPPEREPDNAKSIQVIARLAGVLYLTIAVLAGFVHFYVPGQLLVPGDAVTTAANIRASEGLFRWGMAVELIILLSEVGLSVLLYVLLRPVSQTLSLVATAARLTMTTVHGFNLVNQAVVLLLVSGVGYTAAFTPTQLDALATLFLDAYRSGFLMGIAFLTLHAFALGYLILRSGYFPKALGLLFMIAAVGYLIDSASYVLIANYKTGPAYLALPIALSEIAFPLWLLFKGVRPSEWRRVNATPAWAEAPSLVGEPALAVRLSGSQLS